ncbi:hypothetical protein CLOM_g22499 [Closterium sp. NIES-68]|nr:hypothetical protein CLOM_g22499 [Closterium sp. NIES-68]
MEQYPDADGPHFLFTAVPTLFLAPATPPERGHTASIAARVARFFRAPVPLGAGQGSWHHITGCFESAADMQYMYDAYV